MTARRLALPGGQFAVPGNRWDLVDPSAALDRPLPMISVIVPYYQNRAQLDLVLAGLREQDYPVESFEVIVVDDGSPEPLSLPEGPGPRVRTRRQADHGFRAAAARNLGATTADGQILCFVDQDTVPEPGYLRALSRWPGLIPDALVVGRRRHADLSSWTPAQVRSWFTGTGPAPDELPPPAWLLDGYRDSGNLLTTDDTSYRYVISAVMACSATLFHELGGFDESFTRYGGEDWELAYRAYNAGAVLVHEPAAVAWHDGPDWAGRGDPAEREQKKAEETAALARRIPAPLRPGASDDPSPGDDPDRPVDLVVVWPDTADLDPARLTTTVEALLTSDLNLAIYLDPSRLERGPVSDRSRLHATPVPEDVLARARDLVTIHGHGPVSVADLERVRRPLRSGAAGRVTTAGMTAVSLRAARRAARWQPAAPGVDLVDILFGTTT